MSQEAKTRLLIPVIWNLNARTCTIFFTKESLENAAVATAHSLATRLAVKSDAECNVL